MVLSDEQESNAISSIKVTPYGSEHSVKAEQPEKEAILIVFTLLEIVSFVRLLQNANEHIPILVTPEEILTAFIEEAKKAKSEIRVTSLGMSIYSKRLPHKNKLPPLCRGLDVSSSKMVSHQADISSI